MAKAAIERGEISEAQKILKPLVSLDFSKMQNADILRRQLLALMSIAGLEQGAEILKKDIDL